MRRNRDLMSRLTEADPLRDAGELSREEAARAEALLARLVDTPVKKATDRPRRHRIRGRVLATAAVACAIGAAVVAIDLFDSGSPGRANVVDRAVAAVTREDSVYHVVERVRVRGPAARGPACCLTVAESWNASDGRFHRKAFAVRGGRRGKLLYETVGRPDPGRTVGTILMYDSLDNTVRKTRFGRVAGGAPGIDSSQDPGAGLRRLKQEGKLREAGSTRVGGRRAFRLTSGWVPGPGADRGASASGDLERNEFLVDAETYLPLARRYTIRLRSRVLFDSNSRYTVYERLPLDARGRELLLLDRHPGAGHTDQRGRPLRGPARRKP